MKVYLTVHAEAITPSSVFVEIAAPLVEHPRGWKELSVVQSPDAADSIVTLTPNAVIATMFPQFKKDKLSVCDMLTQAVWINEDRWRRNLPDDSQLPLAAYRAYVLQHELGHALGHTHADPCTKKGDAAPIMIQQTLGIGKCSPNPFPTSNELANQNAPK